MADDKDSDKGFKVEDRRTSSGEVNEKSDEETIAEEIKDDSTPGESGEETATESIQDEQAEDLSGYDKMPRVDFSTFIFSLFSSALIQLGEMEDPINGKKEQNLDAAKQTIDILNVLKDKTEGNLTEEEEKFLENASAELKWKFLNAVKEKG
jgi:flagellar motility protein MotE (MotC chaperone)